MASKKTIAQRAKEFERFIAFVIGGSRVYGQSAKLYVKQSDGEDTGGDAKNQWILGECKAYDPASGTRFRKENPTLPARSFSVQMDWIEKIRKEASEVNKYPFVAFNNKFDRLSEAHIIISLDFFLRLLYAVGWGPFESAEQAWAAWKSRFVDRLKEGE